MGEPEILFLDEPTTGLDPTSRLMMWDVIRGLVAGGTTLLLTTQYLEEADQLAHRIVVVDGGRAIAAGTSDELKAMVGGEVLDVTVTDTASLEDAQRVLADYAVGPIHVDVDARLLAVPRGRRPTVWSRGWSVRSGTRESGLTRSPSAGRPSMMCSSSSPDTWPN